MKQLLITTLLAVTASAWAQSPASVEIKDPWVRATVAQQKATGAFMQLTAKADSKLVEVKSPVAGVVEIHEMAMEKDVMKMRQVPGLALPAGKAVALTLKKYPEMNGFFHDGAFQPAASAHIGVAISLRQGGLIAPAIHDVGEKTLEQLMLDLTDLVKRARAGSLRSSEMSDPTITVTNLGEQGVAAVYGVIYPPQVALAGFGRIVEQPWVENGALTVMPVVTASLAADHRVSDGHRGALFLAELRDLLQQPESL